MPNADHSAVGPGRFLTKFMALEGYCRTSGGELSLISTSPFIGAEVALKTMLKGFRVGEVGIQTFPRQFGKGASTSLRNIWATLKDMRRVYAEVFSPAYDRPLNRQ